MSCDFTFIQDFSYSQWGKSLQELKAFNPQDFLYNPQKQTLALTLTLPFAFTQIQDLQQELLTFVQSKQPEVTMLNLKLQYNISQRAAANGQETVKGVKNIIAVSSCKGGVGKSSVAVNLAAALANGGAKVGLLDADVYGPSIPHMLGAGDQQPTSDDQKTMNPVQVGNLVANSIGFLVGETDATIWRGPVASSMLKQLMVETNWPNLDYLVIDMPPGTGDIQLTVAQNLAVTAAVIVSTPQEIALLDVYKGVNMFRKLTIPVLGIVENMSMYTCPNCGFQAHIFGKDGVKEMSQIMETPLLASIPLDPQVGHDLDLGVITTASQPESSIGQVFNQLADQVAYQTYMRIKSAAPSINITQL
ncbi:iron-sulfur cluster carrier protein ApbC [Psittacicella hinzii]|uniref:Iron-sulfur cluster carrier protein n=1 Tax=Psittacicella hinzii TaxID=2028575 RepID=A0A3A1YSY2_9GAMM|nr:iron-sulfur cluster carrier protein ApbC [Psittacicella hinzii]RIY40601.1 Fe-S-binding ATPase [Psittacicella hinzii]